VKKGLRNNLDEAARLTLLFMLFVLVAVTALLAVSWHASLDARRVDALRINQALVTAIERDKDRVARFAADYNHWGDELLEEGRSVRHNGRDIRTVDADGNFDAMWVLDSRGREVLAIVPEHTGEHHAIAHAQIVQRLIKKSQGKSEPVVKIMRHHDHASIFALSRVINSSDFAQTIGGNGAGYILIQEDLSGSFLNDIERSMQLKSVELRSADGEPGQVPVRDADGKVVASLAWSHGNATSMLGQGRLYFALGVSLLLAGIGFLGTRRVTMSFQSLSRQARLDSLSRLPNRFELLRLIRQRREKNSIAALALIDLDAFKAINDFHGHRIGDAVIRHVAKLLQNCMPEAAMVARLGGDEFAVFFASDGDSAEDCLARFLLRLAVPTEIDGCALKLGASIGLTRLGTSRLAIECLRQADIAMYAAKKRGKMQIAIYDESMEAPLREMIAVKDELFRAIEDKLITVKYQPIISAKTGEIEALEALARWTSPVRGNVAADLFIKVAEEFGLIGKLGELILMRVIDDLKRLPNVRVAMNVSTAQIATFAFVELLEKHILSGEVRGDLLDIEITETHLVHDPEIILQVMNRLSKLGVRFVLDDFGTGYASIGFLRQFPFNAVKIDRMIIEECLVSDQTRAVLASIVAMAHAFDMIVVAEGVETDKHEALARASGCDQLQGWYFGRAVNPGDKSLHQPLPVKARAA
jgi:diguanylate cyclase (GGDEF)-like protein